MTNKTLTSCLGDLGITDAAFFDSCDSADDEFKLIKKSWRTKVLAEHPDKGGDAEAFRTTNASFEVLKDTFQNNNIKNGTFSSYLSAAAKADNAANDIDIDELFAKYSKNTSVPSWDFYAAATEHEVPIYKVEKAKSARSRCEVCKKNSARAAIADSAAADNDTDTCTTIVASAAASKTKKSNAVAKVDDPTLIEKGSIRCGSINLDTGSYGRFHHLECWRVPKKVQNALTNSSDEKTSLRDLLAIEEVLLTGLIDLDEDEQLTFVRHVINQDNWAGNKKRKAKAKPASGSKAKKKKKKNPVKKTWTNIIPGSFTVPAPGMGGATSDENFLKGKTFVITGVFPEVGGGEDDSIGVEQTKSMIESFGGKVISRFSKKTNFLLTGVDPVAKRFKDATAKSIDIINLTRLAGLLKGQITFDRLSKLAALDSDDYTGDRYQPASNSSNVVFDDSKTSPTADAEEQDLDKKPAAVKEVTSNPMSANSDEIPSLLFEDTAEAKPAAAGANPNASTSTALVSVSGKTRFQMPRPGKNGAIADVFDDQRFVLTGLFPEVGGGSGLNLGKDKMKSLIETFGGKVTSAISGKTNFLVIGKDPGRSKVSKASSKSLPLVDLRALDRVIHGKASLDDISNEPAPRITNFSAGYNPKGYLKNSAEW